MALLPWAAFSFFSLAILAQTAFVDALEVPPLRGRVNDFAGLITPDRQQRLEKRLEAFEKETRHQIALLTIPSLEGESLEGFSIKVVEAWKLGLKGIDNGVLLLIAKNDRKLRIEVGYGLEGVLPDALASRIIREVIVPRFRANDLAGGIEAGLETIMRVTRGERLPQSARKPTPDLLAAVLFAFVAVPMIVLFTSLLWIIFSLVIFGRYLRSAFQHKVLGAVFGGGIASGVGAGFEIAPVLGPWIWLWLPFVGALVGAWTINSFMKLGQGRASDAWSGSRYDRSSSWGSSYSSGSSVSSYSGGGFSGGGGGFGGGGASGSW